MKGRNKIALITGASRGLGKNMALQLAKDGVDIIVVCRSNMQEAAAVAKEIESMGRKSVAIQLDVADTNSFDDFFKQVSDQLETVWKRKQFDILINNAGTGHYSPIESTPEDAFEDLYRVHFKGVYFLTQKALPFLADNGRVINLSSGLARFTTPGYAAYASMKGAIEVFTRYLAKELGVRGITVNTLAPGITHTDFTKGTFERNPNMEAHVNTITALGRVGLPDDIGAAVRVLCSDDAHWITAQRVEASGGMNL